VSMNAANIATIVFISSSPVDIPMHAGELAKRGRAGDVSAFELNFSTGPWRQ